MRDAGATRRWIAQQEFETVELALEGETYDVTVKIESDDEVYGVSAEYDDALAVARETGLAVRDVLRRAERSTLKTVRSSQPTRVSTISGSDLIR